MNVVPTLLGLLSAAATFGAAMTCLQSSSRQNPELMIALGVQAIALAVASARSHLQSKRRDARTEMTVHSRCISVAVFVVAMIAIWGGSLSLYGAFKLCNQEFLHWVPVSWHEEFSVPISSMIIELASMGIASLAIGGFLFWYLFFRSTSQKVIERER